MEASSAASSVADRAAEASWFRLRRRAVRPRPARADRVLPPRLPLRPARHLRRQVADQLAGSLVAAPVATAVPVMGARLAVTAVLQVAPAVRAALQGVPAVRALAVHRAVRRPRRPRAARQARLLPRVPPQPLRQVVRPRPRAGQPLRQVVRPRPRVGQPLPPAAQPAPHRPRRRAAPAPRRAPVATAPPREATAPLPAAAPADTKSPHRRCSFFSAQVRRLCSHGAGWRSARHHK